jgi:hypothetical protein
MLYISRRESHHATRKHVDESLFATRILNGEFRVNPAVDFDDQSV